MRNLTIAFLASGSLLSACDGYLVASGPDYPPTSTPGPMTPVGYSCGAGGTLSYYDGTTMQTWSCDAICHDEGYDFATSCGYDAASGGDTCFCGDNGPAAGVCPIAAPSCSGPYSVDSCDASGAVVTWDCDALCQGQGYALSEGCGYDPASREDVCLCASGPSAPPVSCLPSDVACLDGQTIETCGPTGTPIASDCDLVCQGEGFSYSVGCGYDAAQRGDACFCQ